MHPKIKKTEFWAHRKHYNIVDLTTNEQMRLLSKATIMLGKELVCQILSTCSYRLVIHNPHQRWLTGTLWRVSNILASQHNRKAMKTWIIDLVLVGLNFEKIQEYCATNVMFDQYSRTQFIQQYDQRLFMVQMDYVWQVWADLTAVEIKCILCRFVLQN